MGLVHVAFCLLTIDPKRAPTTLAVFVSQATEGNHMARGQPWLTTGATSQEGLWGQQDLGFRFLTGRLS